MGPSGKRLSSQVLETNVRALVGMIERSRGGRHLRLVAGENLAGERHGLMVVRPVADLQQPHAHAVVHGWGPRRRSSGRDARKIKLINTAEITHHMHQALITAASR